MSETFDTTKASEILLKVGEWLTITPMFGIIGGSYRQGLHVDNVSDFDIFIYYLGESTSPFVYGDKILRGQYGRLWFRYDKLSNLIGQLYNSNLYHLGNIHTPSQYCIFGNVVLSNFQKDAALFLTQHYNEALDYLLAKELEATRHRYYSYLLLQGFYINKYGVYIDGVDNLITEFTAKSESEALTLATTIADTDIAIDSSKTDEATTLYQTAKASSVLPVALSQEGVTALENLATLYGV